MAQLVRAFSPGVVPGSSPAMSIDFLSLHSTSNSISSDFVNYLFCHRLSAHTDRQNKLNKSYQRMVRKYKRIKTIILTDLQILLVCHLVLIP